MKELEDDRAAVGSLRAIELTELGAFEATQQPEHGTTVAGFVSSGASA
jgi:hypothetical protein